MFSDFINLFFPDTCVCCGDALQKNEPVICSLCRFKLPESKFHLNNENPVEKLFRGRINMKSAASFLLFQKGGMTQQLIHTLKYKGRTEIGLVIGRLYGHELKRAGWDKKFDVIIPVPLNKNKQQNRGFNQCDFFAKGLAESMGIEYKTNCITRLRGKGTQTKRSRYNRWKNAEGSFVITDTGILKGKNILLVDDVVTTGSTLEACAQALLAVEGTSIGVAAMAYTEN